MWALRNHTPYKAARTWGRDKDGTHEWIVVVKATFDIGPNGRIGLAHDQSEPLLLPEYHGEPGASSLRYDADLNAPKPATDIIVDGTAYAPRSRPSTDFLVALRVGALQKTLRVRGDRYWDDGPLGIRPTTARPVLEVPLVYERAYGGFDRSNDDPRCHRLDLRNPVGRGVATTPDALVGQPLPNFEYPGPGSGSIPAGFGAVDSHWSPRREYAGTYDEAWQRERLPLLPVDWDPRCLLCSPADQRPSAFLRGGERIDLINMTPEGELSFALPRVYLRLRTHLDGRTVEHPARLGSVIIEPDHARLIMVWQSSLKVPTNGEYLDETRITEKVRV